jgi:O-antigen/teichoic acid export membrane protein
VSHRDTPSAFFRQSGWLVLATVSSGVFMTATQIVAYRGMDPAEYGVWFALLRIYLLMSIPSAGLQIIFARQAAAAVGRAEQQQLARAVRATLLATLGLWVIMALVAVAGWRHWLAVLKIGHPAALGITVLIGLASLWAPVVKGVLQGQQNFLGLGWVLILDGVGRFAAVWIILALGGQAAGGMAGALIGTGISLVLGATFLMRLLRAPGAAVDWAPWLRRTVPLTLAIGAIQFMANADVVYVQGLFPAERAAVGYMPAAMIGLALLTFVTPLAAVMFPKVVRDTALTRDTRALELALGATALLAGAAALACTLLPKLPLQIIYFSKPQYWAAAPLVPWFTWSLLPLILANVLIGNLLARERFGVVPWIVVVAAAYGVTLALLKPRLLALPEPDAFRAVVQTLGGFGLVLLGVAGGFTWGASRPSAAPGP